MSSPSHNIEPFSPAAHADLCRCSEVKARLQHAPCRLLPKDLSLHFLHLLILLILLCSTVEKRNPDWIGRAMILFASNWRCIHCDRKVEMIILASWNMCTIIQQFCCVRSRFHPIGNWTWRAKQWRHVFLPNNITTTLSELCSMLLFLKHKCDTYGYKWAFQESMYNVYPSTSNLIGKQHD